MRQHSGSAQLLAEFLQSHSAVSRVRYGGLAAWNRNVGSGSRKGFGGMLGVEWKEDSVHQHLGKHVKLILHATSLGDPVTRVTARREETGPRHTRTLHASIGRLGRAERSDCRFQASDRAMWLGRFVQ